MEYIPKQHQILAADFLRDHDKCALFLDMGLGKTVITLTRIKELLDAKVARCALVIAPKRVAEDTWAREAAKWDHLSDLRVSLVTGTAKRRRARLAKPADVYVISRDNVKWLVEGLNGKWPFDITVLDELTSFKSNRSNRWRYLRRVIGMSDYVLGLTGTPAPNGYIDLWPEMYMVDQGETLGKTLGAYRETYFNPGRSNGTVIFDWRLKHGAKDRIDNLLKKSCLSMSKEDWLTLPPLIFNRIEVFMDSDARKTYDTMLRERVLPTLQGKLSTLDDMDSAVVGSTAAVLSSKLLQMANGSVYDEDRNVVFIHDEKLKALEELSESVGDNLLVFYQYKHDLEAIQKRFPYAKLLESSADIDAWNNGEIKMMLCHPASAAYGINLQQGGHTVAWYGLPWSLELHEQANARLYRQGQEFPVVVHYIVCHDTLDERVLSVLERKDSVQSGLLNALKSYVVEESEKK